VKGPAVLLIAVPDNMTMGSLNEVYADRQTGRLSEEIYALCFGSYCGQRFESAVILPPPSWWSEAKLRDYTEWVREAILPRVISGGHVTRLDKQLYRIN
jgi:hypothetical protein